MNNIELYNWCVINKRGVPVTMILGRQKYNFIPSKELIVTDQSELTMNKYFNKGYYDYTKVDGYCKIMTITDGTVSYETRDDNKAVDPESVQTNNESISTINKSVSKPKVPKKKPIVAESNKNGKGKGKNKGTVFINDGFFMKRVPKSELKAFIADGWEKGRIAKDTPKLYWVTDGDKQKRVTVDELNELDPLVWIKGRLKKS